MKKMMKRIGAVLMAVAMMAALGVTSSFAAGTGKITVTPPEGTQADSENVYTLYQVFDAVTDGSGHYSYKLHGTHDNVPTGFVLDDAGNVFYGETTSVDATDKDFVTTVSGNKVGIKLNTESTLNATTIAAIKAYVTDADKIDTKTVTGRNPAQFTGLDVGYYFVDTTVGSLVVIDSVTPDVNIGDKNDVPPLKKKITAIEDNAGSINPDDVNTANLDEAGKQAIAQVGKKVEYEISITKEKGAQNYELWDEIGAGLKYNYDATVKIGTNDVPAASYTKTEADNSLRVSFDNDYMASLNDGTVITVKYNCVVTNALLQVNYAKNTAWLTYGRTPGKNKTPVEETKTYNAKFSVEKKDDKNQPLSGAGFVLKNSAGKYYKYTAPTTSGTTVTSPETIEWVDSIDDATEYTSGSDGKLNGDFTGLPNGTYTLVEKTVPNGYNKAVDYDFTINGADHENAFTAANLIQSTTVINKQGAKLPATGGIGTYVFTIAGVAIMAVAAGLLVIRHKKKAE